MSDWQKNVCQALCKRRFGQWREWDFEDCCCAGAAGEIGTVVYTAKLKAVRCRLGMTVSVAVYAGNTGIVSEIRISVQSI